MHISDEPMGFECFLKAWGLIRNKILLLRLKHETTTFVLCNSHMTRALVHCGFCIRVWRSVGECMFIFIDLCMGVFRPVCVNFTRLFVHIYECVGAVCAYLSLLWPAVTSYPFILWAKWKCRVGGKLINLRTCHQHSCLITLLFFTVYNLISYLQNM